LQKVLDKTGYKPIIVCGRVVCNVCGKDFKNRDHVKRHWRQKHLGKTCICDVCGMSFRKDSLQQHKIRKHGTEEEQNRLKEKCSICNINIFDLKRHMRQIHYKRSGVKHKCDQCGAEFLIKAYLKRHLRIHSEGPQKCDLCSQICTTSKGLQIHKNVAHSEEWQKKYCCDKCPAKFFYRPLLKSHLMSHESTAGFICEECGKSYKCPSSLRQHKKIHVEPTEQLTCDICNDGKEFKNINTFQQHKRKCHSKNGSNLYQCSFCGKRQSSGAKLRTHENLHKEVPGFIPRKRKDFIPL